MAEGNNSGNLFSSGKLVAEAAASVFQLKSAENVDKKEVAGAAADILHAASTYGKFEDKPAGQYIEKAEGYLKEFSTGHAGAGAEQPGDAAPRKPAAPAPAEAEAPKEPAVPAPAAEEGGKSSSEGFGLGDVVKDAEQLVEKQGGGGEESSAGAAGGLFKMAQGFLK
ncbi:nodulin-related protein 2-like [Miscanthus floridulus]|uniref:nodulin-related protein 2-like n=1 Tax=Miscanthus floridulus TaxID=154761 RepID=UPI0034586CA1